MSWLLASPGHQQPWYWLCRMGRSLSYLRKDINHLCHINVAEWQNVNICFMFPLKNLARKGLTFVKGNPLVTCGFPSQKVSHALMFSLLILWASCWTSSSVAGDFRWHDSHVTLLCYFYISGSLWTMLLSISQTNAKPPGWTWGKVGPLPNGANVWCLTHWPLGDLNEILNEWFQS